MDSLFVFDCGHFEDIFIYFDFIVHGREAC
jgi:hypothetical protein